MKGYKAFYFDLSCRTFAGYPMMYEVGKTYEFPEEPVLCKKGFHFCEELPYVYVWYCQAFDIRVCEIEATGTILTETDPPQVRYQPHQDRPRTGAEGNTGHCAQGGCTRSEQFRVSVDSFFKGFLPATGTVHPMGLQRFVSKSPDTL